jgi:hypothetical protein
MMMNKVFVALALLASFVHPFFLVCGVWCVCNVFVVRGLLASFVHLSDVDLLQLSFLYWVFVYHFRFTPAAATAVQGEVLPVDDVPAAATAVQGEVLPVDDVPPVGTPVRDSTEENGVEEDDSSGDDYLPSLCQLRRELLSSRLRNAAFKITALEAQVAQHRTERAQHIVLRGDVAALHADHAYVLARHSSDIREITRIFAVIILFILCAVINLHA